MTNKKGILFVVSGPSGAGKGTICRAILKKSDRFSLSVSATTRSPREGEIEGEHYYFLSRDDFEQRIGNNEFIEYNEYCENLYGTLRSEVDRVLSEGKDCILEIDVNGGLNVKKVFPEAVLIFILPPTVEILKARLIKRGTETIDVIEKRLDRVRDEISKAPFYDYLLMNDDLDVALQDFDHIHKSLYMSMKKSIDTVKTFSF